MWQAWTNGLLGLWLAIVPFIFTDTYFNKINNICVGLVVLIVSWIIPKETAWQRWTMIILGAWIFIASFFPALTDGSGYMWNNFISGILITVYAITLGGKSSTQTKDIYGL